LTVASQHYPTRIGNRVGQSKSTKPPTSVVEEQYKALTQTERVEFTLLVRQELHNSVIGSIRALAKVVESETKGNAQAKVSAARALLLMAEKHGVLKGSIDPLASFAEEWQAALEGQDELRRED
jgi:hypothetical protein